MQSKLVGPQGQDRYELQQELGRGATAIVHRALDLQTNQIVAIKEMLKFDIKAQKIIKQEINIMEQLKHQNFVNYITHFTRNKRWYIVMEYCGKGTLEQYMANAGRIPQAHCRLFIKCIVRALIFLHEQRNIAHRDIKQVNILIHDNFTLKIADFGYSKLSEINYYQTIVGTLPLMAPEILKQMPYSKKVDVWSLGVLLYMMIYNRQPYRPTNFDGGNNIIGWKNTVDRFKLTFDPNVQVSTACKQFMKQCLEKDVDKRPTSLQLIKHEWLGLESKINTTKQGIFNILSQKFKNARDDVVKFLKKMFVGVFEEHTNKMLKEMQLSEEKITKLVEVLQNQNWSEEVSECCLGLIKLKLQELAGRQFLFVIETKSYPIRLDQIKRFNQYLARINKLVETCLQRIQNKKTDKLKFKRKISEFILNQVQQLLDLTSEGDIVEVIPFLKNLCSLVIKEYAVSQVIVKWGENSSYDTIASILIQELEKVKSDTIVTSVNEQPSHTEDLRAMWLIENQIKVIPPTKNAEIQNCQASLQVLSIPSNFSSDPNLLLQKEQVSQELMDLDK